MEALNAIHLVGQDAYHFSIDDQLEKEMEAEEDAVFAGLLADIQYIFLVLMGQYNRRQ